MYIPVYYLPINSASLYGFLSDPVRPSRCDLQTDLKDICINMTSTNSQSIVYIHFFIFLYILFLCEPQITLSL